MLRHLMLIGATVLLAGCRPVHSAQIVPMPENGDCAFGSELWASLDNLGYTEIETPLEDTFAFANAKTRITVVVYLGPLPYASIIGYTVAMAPTDDSDAQARTLAYTLGALRMPEPALKWLQTQTLGPKAEMVEGQIDEYYIGIAQDNDRTLFVISVACPPRKPPAWVLTPIAP